jgi:small-conductance mechanosensitive channel
MYLIYIFLQILALFVIAVAVISFAYWWTEGRGEYKPDWLNYKPFNCKICLTFWTLIVIYVTIGLTLNLNLFLWGGIIFAAANALAMKIDEKNKTISIDEYDGIDK